MKLILFIIALAMLGLGPLAIVGIILLLALLVSD